MLLEHGQVKTSSFSHASHLGVMIPQAAKQDSINMFFLVLENDLPAKFLQCQTNPTNPSTLPQTLPPVLFHHHRRLQLLTGFQGELAWVSLRELHILASKNGAKGVAWPVTQRIVGILNMLPSNNATA